MERYLRRTYVHRKTLRKTTAETGALKLFHQWSQLRRESAVWAIWCSFVRFVRRTKSNNIISLWLSQTFLTSCASIFWNAI